MPTEVQVATSDSKIMVILVAEVRFLFDKREISFDSLESKHDY